MEKERLEKIVDALKELDETTAFMVVIGLESFLWLWVTALINYFPTFF